MPSVEVIPDGTEMIDACDCCGEPIPCSTGGENACDDCPSTLTADVSSYEDSGDPGAGDCLYCNKTGLTLNQDTLPGPPHNCGWFGGYDPTGFGDVAFVEIDCTVDPVTGDPAWRLHTDCSIPPGLGSNYELFIPRTSICFPLGTYELDHWNGTDCSDTIIVKIY